MDLTPENFERLLNWLHPNPEEAGQEYERIRALLIRKFASHGCSCPDGLADTTIDRTAQTITEEMIEKWEGKKERYFFRVAYFILLEDRARKIVEVELPEELLVAIPETIDLEPALNCQDKCLQELTSSKRELIIKYYGGNKATKIKNRGELARKRKVTLPVLRVQALRIRRQLKTCIVECLDHAEALKL